MIRTPEVPENPDDWDEDKLADVQDEMDEDYEIGIAFKDQIIPRAVEWYTGEAVTPMLDGDYDEGEFGEFEDEAQ